MLGVDDDDVENFQSVFYVQAVCEVRRSRFSGEQGHAEGATKEKAACFDERHFGGR
jgi:hypothetical protein